MGSEKVSGNHEQDPNLLGVLTGQVCARHRVKQYDDGKPPWCAYCGKDDDGNQQGRPNGGWGT